LSNLGFVSIESYELAVNHVIKAIEDAKSYEESIINAINNNNIFSSDFFSNALDPFTMQFGMSLSSDKNWIATEVKRQLYKTFEQKIGEFHQKLLGSVDGWNDLGVGDDSKVDLSNDNGTIFIELKNKFNTCNSDALAKVRDKLLNVIINNNEAIAYWAFIVPATKSKQGSAVWKQKRRVIHPNLYKAWGAEVYRIVTGDSNNLFKTYNALDEVILKLNKNNDTLDTIGDRIITLLDAHINDIKNQVFYRTVAEK
jgi:hypothetical protein